MKVAKIEILSPQETCVYDIGVRKNNNFFIRPKGSKESVLVSNCHQLLAPAQNALLKTLEEPPSRTLWMLSTTNPEKLLPAILGRCTKLNLVPIEPEALIKRLRIISKREGVNLREFEGGDAILKTIANLSNGKMRDAISILESAIYAIKSNKNVDAKTVLNNFTNTGEAELEKVAAEVLIAIIKGNVKGVIVAVRVCNNPRGILSKLRWIVQHLLDAVAGIAKYTPYGAKLFNKMSKEEGIKINSLVLIRLQQLLVEVESRFNTMSIDESVVLLSALGTFAADNKR
jgi:DNA polymerase III gamma/tau subunit